MRLSGEKGFTLAEVLVALTIVGIAMTLTIPVIAQKMQEIQLKTAYKEAYTLLDQVTTKIMRDNGGTMKGVIGDSNEDFRGTYLYYLNSMKQCDYPNARGNCWASKFYMLNGTETRFIYTKPDNNGGVDWTDISGTILNNGISLIFIHYSTNCALDGGIEGCGAIYIDVNSLKGPNIFGKDIFAVYVLANGMKPYGYNATNDGMRNCLFPPDSAWDIGSNTGYACGLYYLQGSGLSTYYHP